MLARVFFISLMILYSNFIVTVLSEDTCEERVVLVKIPDVDAFPLTLYETSFGLWPDETLREGVDGWPVLLGGRILLNKSLFFSSRVDFNIGPLLLRL